MKYEALRRKITQEIREEISQEVMDEIEFQNRLGMIDCGIIGLIQGAVAVSICVFMNIYLNISYEQHIQMLCGLTGFNIFSFSDASATTAKDLVSNTKWQMGLALFLLGMQKILGY